MLDGEGEAYLVTRACSEPPAGRKHWSLRLWQGRFMRLGHVDHISYETICRVLTLALAGKCFVEVTEKRRKVEWATVMKRVSFVLYPQADKITAVLDNLNTHTPSAFYETFAPEQTRRLVERFEFHFTPEHRFITRAIIQMCYGAIKRILHRTHILLENRSMLQ